jgi:hypothetical protein
MSTSTEQIELCYGNLDGKPIGYSTATEFQVQVGRGAKGSYKTRYRLVGNLSLACFYYRGINIGNGYKKRLVMPSSARQRVLARAAS